jgi:uncharacterized protein (DUF2384 family)
MRTAFAPHPTGRSPVERLVDLSDPGEIERLSAPGLRAFFRIADAWQLRDDDARQLLSVSRATYYAWKRDPRVKLGQDQLTRVSYLIGIYKALGILYGPALARDWMTLPNTGGLFAGRTPLEHVLRGGIPAMASVRALLDARRGGA